MEGESSMAHSFDRELPSRGEIRAEADRMRWEQRLAKANEETARAQAELALVKDLCAAQVAAMSVELARQVARADQAEARAKLNAELAAAGVR